MERRVERYVEVEECGRLRVGDIDHEFLAQVEQIVRGVVVPEQYQRSRESKLARHFGVFEQVQETQLQTT